MIELALIVAASTLAAGLAGALALRLLPSVGARYVLVAGTLVVDGGRIVEGVAPGRPISADAPGP